LAGAEPQRVPRPGKRDLVTLFESFPFFIFLDRNCCSGNKTDAKDDLRLTTQKIVR
jgi:hypothetical protein